jgi:hypothetical protein
MLSREKLEVVDIRARGGLFTFLGHQFSSVFVCLFWSIPVLKHIALLMNKWFCTLPCYFLDKFVVKTGVFAEGYTVVARKVV